MFLTYKEDESKKNVPKLTIRKCPRIDSKDPVFQRLKEKYRNIDEFESTDSESETD